MRTSTLVTQTTTADGVTEFRMGGKLHRRNGPAVLYPNGSMAWYTHGRLHSVDDKPALVDMCGGNVALSWYRSGYLHRTSGPARVFPNGDTEWWLDGMLHRGPFPDGTVGPAFTRAGEVVKYYRLGRLHRNDGPAVIYANGNVEYWRNGKRCQCVVVSPDLAELALAATHVDAAVHADAVAHADATAYPTAYPTATNTPADPDQSPAKRFCTPACARAHY